MVELTLFFAALIISIVAFIKTLSVNAWPFSMISVGMIAILLFYVINIYK